MMRITYERAAGLFTYDPDTGVIKHKIYRNSNASAGSVAGHITKRPNNAYHLITAGNRRYYAHQIAWLLFYGEWPVKHIDHINGDGLDNRLCNLRLATRSENMSNSRRSKLNSTGYKGVRIRKGNPPKYEAVIKKNRKAFYLGTFDNPQDAYQAYCEAAEQLHGEFARAE